MTTEKTPYQIKQEVIAAEFETLRATFATNGLEGIKPILVAGTDLHKEFFQPSLVRKHADMLLPMGLEENTGLSALAKKVVIENAPLLYSKGPHIPIIASTNIKTLLNPWRTADDFLKAITNIDNHSTPLDVYNVLYNNSPLNQTEETAKALVGHCMDIANKTSKNTIHETMPELCSLFNWAFLHCYICNIIPHSDTVELERCYNKTWATPALCSFMFEY